MIIDDYLKFETHRTIFYKRENQLLHFTLLWIEYFPRELQKVIEERYFSNIYVKENYDSMTRGTFFVVLWSYNLENLENW